MEREKYRCKSLREITKEFNQLCLKLFNELDILCLQSLF